MLIVFVKALRTPTSLAGPTSRCVTSCDQPPDIRELFVYKLLERISVGPEAHFMTQLHGSHRTVYIATKHVDFQHLDDLTADTADYNSLLLIDFPHTRPH